MTDDDPPKKPPRASWEPPDPDEKPAPSPRKHKRADTPPPRASWEPPEPEAAPARTSKKPPPIPAGTNPPAVPSGASETAPTAAPWEPPPVEPVPRTPTPRAETAPRASWEAPVEEPPSHASQPPAETPPASWESAPAETPPASSESAARWEQPAESAPATTSGTWDASASSTETPLGADLPAPPSASVIVEPAMTSASMIAPVPPASAMVDDPRLPTIPPSPPVPIAEKPKRKKAPPPDDFDDDPDYDEDGKPRRKRSGKLVVAGAAILVLGVGIGALVFLGSLNKERYLLACEPQQVIAKQGRGFPPWGERSIDDEGMWKPIKIPPEAECTPQETEDESELSRWYLEILVARASVALTAKEGAQHGSKEIDEAFAMLEQALLHTRATDRREQRREIERLLGDVGYWRANGKLKDAANALSEAAKQYDAAAAQRPRHVSDASAWANHVRKLVEQLEAGPNGAATVFPPTPPTPDRVPAPPGTALPVEPPKAGTGSADPAPPPIDAGLPTGGVLL